MTKKSFFTGVSNLYEDLSKRKVEID